MLVFDAGNAAAVERFRWLARRKAVQLRLDLSDPGQLQLEFFDDFRDLGREFLEVAVTWRSGRSAWAGRASFSTRTSRASTGGAASFFLPSLVVIASVTTNRMPGVSIRWD